MPRLCAVSIVSGTKIWAAPADPICVRPTSRNAVGTMPTIWWRVPFRVIERPTTAGSRPNPRTQSDSASTATGGAPGCSSSPLSGRPTIGATPSTLNNDAVTALADDALRIAMLGDDEVPAVEGRQRVEAPGALDPRQIVEQRHAEEGPAAGAAYCPRRLRRDDPPPDTARPQEHAVHHAEDGGVRADAQRQRQNGRQRKDWRPPPCAPGMSHVLHERRGLFPGRGAHQIGDEREPDAAAPSPRTRSR